MLVSIISRPAGIIVSVNLVVTVVLIVLSIGKMGDIRDVPWECKTAVHDLPEPVLLNSLATSLTLLGLDGLLHSALDLLGPLLKHRVLVLVQVSLGALRHDLQVLGRCRGSSIP